MVLFEMADKLGAEFILEINKEQYSLITPDANILIKREPILDYPLGTVKDLLTRNFEHDIIVTAANLKRAAKSIGDEDAVFTSIDIFSDTFYMAIADGETDVRVTVSGNVLKDVATKMSGDVHISYSEKAVRFAYRDGIYVIGGE